MDDIISPSVEFRKSIIALLFFSDWLMRYGPIIDAAYFPTRQEQRLVDWVNQYYAAYKDAPTIAAAEQGLNDNAIVAELSAVEEPALHYAADVALEFAQTQAMKLAVLRAVDAIKEGKLRDVRGMVEEALAVGSDRSDLGWELVKDADQWLYEELRGRKFPTGWPTIDNILHGGLVAGEYGLVMAPPGMGKTTMLVNIGYAIAGLMGAANVLHVTLEIPKQKVLRRYATRVLGKSVSRGSSNVRDVSASLARVAHTNLRAKLRVHDSVRDIDGIRRLIDNLLAEGFVTEALIVDYADLLIPPRRREERRFELADITRDLRMLGSDYEMPVWSASQAGRDSMYKEIIGLQNIAEAIEKAAIADVVVSLCYTRDEEKLGRGRLFGAKVRDAEGKFVVPVKINFETQSIVQRGRSNG